MIVCTRCGAANEDGDRFCLSCGRKLQSSRQALDDGSGLERPRDPLTPLDGTGGGGFLRLALRCLEVWGAVGLLLGSVAYGLATRTWWPVPVAGGLALLALLHRY